MSCYPAVLLVRSAGVATGFAAALRAEAGLRDGAQRSFSVPVIAAARSVTQIVGASQFLVLMLR